MINFIKTMEVRERDSFHIPPAVSVLGENQAAGGDSQLPIHQISSKNPSFPCPFLIMKDLLQYKIQSHE